MINIGSSSPFSIVSHQKQTWPSGLCLCSLHSTALHSVLLSMLLYIWPSVLSLFSTWSSGHMLHVTAVGLQQRVRLHRSPLGPLVTCYMWPSSQPSKTDLTYWVLSLFSPLHRSPLGPLVPCYMWPSVLSLFYTFLFFYFFWALAFIGTTILIITRYSI